MIVAPYQLSVDGFAAGHFRVHSLEGNETISEAWCFDVVVTAPAGEDVERAALAQRATLIFNVHDEPRAFYGIVAAVRLAEVHAADHAVKYVVRVVPRLWLLRRKTRTRIFQKMRVPDIVSAVLLEAGITTRWQLIRAYPEREYCTQYEETDYRFVRRILAEAGIYFYFFGGGPVSGAAFAADAAVGVAASVGGSVAGFTGGSAMGGLVGAAAQMAETLIPGDTVVGADDASCYPPVGGDHAGALAASTAAAMAPAVGDAIGGALGVGGGMAGAAFAAASAVAGTVIADLTESAHRVPALHFMANEAAQVTTYDKVTRFTLRNTVRSTGAAFRDYDPDRPMVRLQSIAVSTQPFPPSPFEIAAEAAAAAESAVAAVGGLLGGPAAGALGDAVANVDSVVNELGAALGQKVPYEIYEHHSPFLFPKWAFGGDEAPRMLRQKRRRASIAEGEGGCSDLSPGHRFTLEDHPATQLDGAYVVTTVKHRGETHPSSGEGWRVYWNTFECAPAQMPYVPPRPKRKSVQVTLTATVVGPEGEEIHVDEKAQIKVQFHWDREGKYDPKSSCWIRTMQPWAGAAWGHQFIPRVGTEVVVVFEGGDPDKPIVLGSLNNGTHPPPFLLPGDKTRSGIRTQSSPRGGGFNELSFEDAAGREQVYLRAQRDLDEVVGREHTTSVARNQRVTVGANRTENVQLDQIERVGGRRVESVVGNHEEEIGKDRRTTIRGSDTETVEKSRTTSIGGDLQEQVTGNHVSSVGTNEHPKQRDSFAWGKYLIGSDLVLDLSARNGVRLRCGESMIELTQDGIELKADTIVISAKKVLNASGKGPKLTLGDEVQLVSKTIRFFSSKASLLLDDEAHLDGEKVKLNCQGVDPDSVDGEGQPVKTKRFSLKLSDGDFASLADKDYVLVAGGAKLEGRTSGEGVVEHDIPDDADVATLTVWIEDRPEGRSVQYRVKLGALDDASVVSGAQARLKNLGYYAGSFGDILDSDTRAALKDFQVDHQLEATGALDAGTVQKLTDVHGH